MDHPTAARAGRHVGIVAAMAALILATALVFGFGAYRVDAQQATPAENACGGGTPTAGAATAAAGTATAGGDCVEIASHDIYFAPNLVTIPADTPVRVMLPNQGVSPHDFSITAHHNEGLKNLGINIALEPGKTAQTTINAPAGDYYFYCNLPGHEQAGMFGYLQVKANAPITTEVATVTPRAGS